MHPCSHPWYGFILYHIPTSGLSTLLTRPFALSTRYWVSILGSVQSSMDSISSFTLWFLMNLLGVLYWAPRPFIYSSGSLLLFSLSNKSLSLSRGCSSIIFFI